MLDLHKEDVDKIYEVTQRVQQKWQNKRNTGENLSRLHRELTGRLEDLGFDVTVDVTPCLAGEPISLVINGKTDGLLYDPERKRWEVRKRTSDEDDPGHKIEGVV